MRKWALIMVLLTAMGCDSSQPRRRPGPVRVVVSVAPLTGLVKDLLPSDAEVRTLVPPGRSLHGFEMTPADLAALGDADLVVYVGLGLDPQVAAFLKDHPRADREEVCFAAVANIAPGADGLSEAASAEETDDHHHPAAADPHLWLDPVLVQSLIVELHGLMRRLPGSPQDAESLTAQETLLLQRVARMDTKYREALAPFAGAAIVTHHNAFSRLAERYHLTIAAVIRPIESEEPTPGEVAAAVDAVRTSGARAVFVEPQLSAAGAKALADQVGVPVGTLDPEGLTDWFALMQRNLSELVRVLTPPSP